MDARWFILADDLTGAADCAIAFQREIPGTTLLVVAPLLTCRVGFPPLGDRWKSTVVEPPVKREWVDLLTGRKFDREAELRVAAILSDLPIAVLVAKE